jgi:hypothetical protein
MKNILFATVTALGLTLSAGAFAADGGQWRKAGNAEFAADGGQWRNTGNAQFAADGGEWHKVNNAQFADSSTGPGIQRHIAASIG